MANRSSAIAEVRHSVASSDREIRGGVAVHRPSPDDRRRHAAALGLGSFGANEARASTSLPLAPRRRGPCLDLRLGHAGATGNFSFYNLGETLQDPRDDRTQRRQNNAYDRLLAQLAVHGQRGAWRYSVQELLLSKHQGIPGLATGYLGDATNGFRRAAHAYPQGGEGGLTSTVEDLLIWSRHFDQPTLTPKTLPSQLAAVSPLTGKHANKYRRGVQTDNLRGLATIGHGGLWPGFRTEFLRMPEANLTVVVIANLGSIDPWRQARAIATLALENNKKLKAAPAPITEAEIKPLAGTWFNAQEPSMFDLAWQNGEATVTQNGLSFVLGRRADGWLAAERGSFEFALKPGAKATVRVDLGAGRVMTFAKLGRRKAAPTALAGTYVSTDTGAIWRIERKGDAWEMLVGGPLIAGGAPWTVQGIDDDTVEVASSAGNWINITQLAHIVRDRRGRITALEVSTGRIKKMRFDRQN